LAAQVERVRELERQVSRIIPYLFPHLSTRLKGNASKIFATAGRQHAEKRASRECSAMILEEAPFGTW